MRKIISLVFVLTILLVSCTDDTLTSSSDPSNETLKESSEISINESSFDDSEHTTDESVDDGSQDDVYIESNVNKIVLDRGGTGSDIPYYSHYGNNIYVFSQDEKGNVGTKKFTNGEFVEFYPDAYNVYEKDGELYGIVIHGDCSCDFERSYCKLDEEGNHETLIDCWQVFYLDDKIYYYDTVLDEEKSKYYTHIYSADIDGSNISIVSDEVAGTPTRKDIIKYNGYMIYPDFNGGIYAKAPDDKTFELLAWDDQMVDVQFVKDGYVYYTVFYDGWEDLINFTVYHSLWRVDLNGENRECLVENAKYHSYNYHATSFSDEIIIFAPDKILVYDSDFSEYEEFDCTLLGFDDIDQICVLDDTLAISGWVDNEEKFKTVIYDSIGNVVFETVA